MSATFRDLPVASSITLSFRRALLGVLLAGMAGCTAKPNDFKVLRLSSGKQIRTNGTALIQYSRGGQALMLKYDTHLKLSNSAALRTEIDQIWQVFRPDVEEGNYIKGIIYAEEAPSFFDFARKSVGNGQDFVFTRRPDGAWHLQDQNPK